MGRRSVGLAQRGLPVELLILLSFGLALLPVGKGVLPRIDRKFFDPPPIANELGAPRSDYRIRNNFV